MTDENRREEEGGGGHRGLGRDLKWEIYGGGRQIEEAHVRGEMMHKWNKDERIGSLYWETETQ